RLTRRGIGPLAKTFQYRHLTRSLRAAAKANDQKGRFTNPNCVSRGRFSQQILLSSGVRSCEFTRPLAISASLESGVRWQLTRHGTSQQPRLDFKHPAIADTIPKEWMCDQRIHPLLVRLQKSLPPPRGQRHGLA